MVETGSDRSLFCRTLDDGSGSSRPKLKDRKKGTGDEGRMIRCRHCGQPVTSHAQRTVVAGSHTHTFFNPSGIVFELGCFRKAHGCRSLGQPTMEFTWFAGYSWRFAICSGCNSHLGWRYDGNGDSFYGLVLRSLVQ